MSLHDAAYWQDRIDENLRQGAHWQGTAITGARSDMPANAAMALVYATRAQACATAMLACQMDKPPVRLGRQAPKCSHCEDKGEYPDCKTCGLCPSCKLYKVHLIDCLNHPTAGCRRGPG
jgi:hypothetical protein